MQTMFRHTDWILNSLAIQPEGSLPALSFSSYAPFWLHIFILLVYSFAHMEYSRIPAVNKDCVTFSKKDVSKYLFTPDHIRVKHIVMTTSFQLAEYMCEFIGLLCSAWLREACLQKHGRHLKQLLHHRVPSHHR